MSKKDLKEKADSLPATISYEEDAGSGFEGVDAESFAVPFLAIVQKGTPIADPDSPEYRDDVKPGMLVNTVTQEVYECRNDVDGAPAVLVVPCAYKRQYLEWAPRDSGGGLQGIHTVAEASELLTTATKDDKGQDVLPNGNILTDTRMHYCLMQQPDSTWLPVIISMSSTQIKKSRRWMTRMDNIKFTRADGSKFTPAMFAHVWSLQTIKEENNKGTWRGWKIELEHVVDDAELYEAARKFRDMVVNDEVKPAQVDGAADDIDM